MPPEKRVLTPESSKLLERHIYSLESLPQKRRMPRAESKDALEHAEKIYRIANNESLGEHLPTILEMLKSDEYDSGIATYLGRAIKEHSSNNLGLDEHFDEVLDILTPMFARGGDKPMNILTDHPQRMLAQAISYHAWFQELTEEQKQKIEEKMGETTPKGFGFDTGIKKDLEWALEGL